MACSVLEADSDYSKLFILILQKQCDFSQTGTDYIHRVFQEE